jgi:hypothetical protein
MSFPAEPNNVNIPAWRVETVQVSENRIYSSAPDG